MTFYFAWVDELEAFSETHWREDEFIYSMELSQAEGEFASLEIEILNPRVGLMAPGRKQWCWLAYDRGAVVVPLFHGQLIAIPQGQEEEIITLTFRGKPTDFIEQKAAVAASLRVLPYYDPIWFEKNAEDDDTVLETYSSLWHIDRVTNEVSVSDILVGEAGIVVLTEDDLFEASIKIGETPQTFVTVNVEVTWQQQAIGDVDLSNLLYIKFLETGSPFRWPLVGSLTSNGLASSWPPPGASIGAGWIVGLQSQAYLATYANSGIVGVSYVQKSDDVETQWSDNSSLLRGSVLAGYAWPFGQDSAKNNGWVTWRVGFPLDPIYQQFIVSYSAERDRSETLQFTLYADLQQVSADPADAETIDLQTELISQPVDAGGATPIGDLRRNSYFPTDRGQLSLQCLMLMARAKLRMKSRAAEIEITIGWDAFLDAELSCRHSITLIDRHLPGGSATGKVIDYTLSYEADNGEMLAELTIGCAIGRGTPLPAANAGEDDYAEDYSDNYTEMLDIEITIIDGEIVYSGFDNLYVVDDDGVDFFNMTADRVVLELAIVNGANDQFDKINYAVYNGGLEPDPIAALGANPTVVNLSLVPVTGGAFLTNYAVAVSDLVIPKMIDLEAA